MQAFVEGSLSGHTLVFARSVLGHWGLDVNARKCQKCHACQCSGSCMAGKGYW